MESNMDSYMKYVNILHPENGVFKYLERTPIDSIDHYIVGWEQERPISARRVRASYLGSTRKNVSSRVGG